MKTALLISLSLALALSGLAATITPVPYSSEPSTNTIKATDWFIVNVTNTGAGSQSTKRASVGGAVTNTFLPLLTPAIQGIASATVGSNVYSLATFTNSGIINTNGQAHLFSVPRTGWLRTPPDGFCSYGETWPGGVIYETNVLYAASNMWRRGYIAAGAKYLILEDGWAITNRDAAGKIMCNSNSFPHGMRWLSDTVWNTYGVALGLWADAAPLSGYPSVSGFNPSTGFDAIERDANTICGEWAIKYVRLDNNTPGFQDPESVRIWLERFCMAADNAAATNQTRPDRPVIRFFWGLPPYWVAGKPTPVPAWVGNLVDVLRFGNDQDSEAHVVWNLDWLKTYSYCAGPGHFIHAELEPDSGTVGGWTDGQARRDAGLGAMMGTPLQWSWDGLPWPTPVIHAIKEAMVTNASLREIRWDSLAIPATSIYTNNAGGTNQWELWLKTLAKGDYALSMWNRDTNANTMSFYLTNLPGWGTNVVAFQDIWAQTNGQATNALTWTVPAKDLQLFRLSKPGPGPSGLTTNYVLSDGSTLAVEYGKVLSLQGSDPDALSFISRASLSNTAQKAAVVILVNSLKAGGVWTNLHAVYPFVGGTSNANAVNLVSTNYTITWSGGLTHDANGVTGNGTNGYGNTGYAPSTGGQTTNSAHYFVYQRLANPAPTNATYTCFLGAEGPTTYSENYLGTYRDGSAVLWQGMVGPNSGLLGIPSKGYYYNPGNYMMNRTNSASVFWIQDCQPADCFIYYSGGSDKVCTDLAIRPIFLLALSNNGSPADYSGGNLAFASMGMGLPPNVITNYLNAVTAFESALGR